MYKVTKKERKKRVMPLVTEKDWNRFSSFENEIHAPMTNNQDFLLLLFNGV